MNNKKRKIITINIITYHNQYGLSNDVKILLDSLRMIFSKKFKITFNHVDFYKYFCPQADINIFLEIVNQLMIKYATHNLFIPNQEWFYKHWKPYLKDFDSILSKTTYTSTIFKPLLQSRQSLHEISWTSIDRFKANVERDYTTYLHLCGKSIYKNTQTVVDLWKPTYPKLVLVYSPKDVDLKPKSQENIVYITQRLPEESLIELMNRCPVHICCSAAEGFGHYINEAKSTKAVVVTVDAPPMNQLIYSKFGFLVKKTNRKSLKKTLGTRVSLDTANFTETIEKIIQMTNNKTGQKQCQKLGQAARDSFMKTKKQFRQNMERVIRPWLQKSLKTHTPTKSKDSKNNHSKNNHPKGYITNNPSDSNPSDTSIGKQSPEKFRIFSDSELPHISIATPTYNRKKLFQMAIYNFKNLDYPLEKVEWVIVDDSDSGETVEDILPKDERIKYISLPKKVTIGKKRNLCVEHCSNPYIVFMDDDDYYYPESVRRRISYLLESKKECVYCTSIACFHINKYISMINVPPHQLPFQERISEASLAFTKSFWEQQPFADHSRGGEAKEFLKGRFDNTQEVSWEQILVSLLHSRNTSHKELITDQPNGCHYGFSDELFLFITGLDSDKND